MSGEEWEGSVSGKGWEGSVSGEEWEGSVSGVRDGVCGCFGIWREVNAVLWAKY